MNLEFAPLDCSHPLGASTRHPSPPRGDKLVAIAIDNKRPLLTALLFVFAVNAYPSIYSCVDASGRRITADRPIVECISREQQLLNTDGSVRKVLPPTLTAEELAAVEAAERKTAADRATKQDAVRHDRNLMARYPNEARHRRARESALNDTRRAISLSERRLKLLADERKPLLDEAEFYIGRPLPGHLRRALDANDAAVGAQHTLIQNQRAEAVRIDALYDAELERLKRLWGGARPGSVGPPSAEAASTAAVSAPLKSAEE